MKHNNYTLKQINIQSFRKYHFNHLSLADRLNIEKLINLKNDKNYNGPKITITYIARIIGVNKSTISREINRGTFHHTNQITGTPTSSYLATFGQGSYDKNKKRSHYKRKLEKYSPELKELVSLIKRQTRIYLSFKIKIKEMKNIVEILDSIETKIGKESFIALFKSITFDNGTEFRDFKGMSKSIFDNESRTKIYYANPYRSYSRSYSHRKLLNNLFSAESLKHLNQSSFKIFEMLGPKYSNHLM